VAVTALSLALLVSGCGSSSSEPSGPPPTAASLMRDSLAAAAAAPGAEYELVLDAKLDGNLPTALHKYVTGDPHVRATGTVGRDVFTSHVTSSIPAVAILTGDELRAGAHWAYLRYQSTWYGSASRGLRNVWPLLPRLVVGAPNAMRGDLVELLATAIDARVTAGPSLDGTDTWELAGRLRAHAIRAILRLGFGSIRLTNPRVFAARSKAVFDAGRDDRLPRRARFEFTLLSSDLPRALARQFPEVHRADIMIELDLTKWGPQPQPQRPPAARTFAEYLRMTGLGR
jgi:hypothetical protein